MGGFAQHVDRGGAVTEGRVGKTALAAARLAPPRTSYAIVARPRLIEALNRCSKGPITLISGEPASGKTSLVIGWLDSIDHRERAPIWLTIGSDADDPVRFWRYLVAAFEPVVVGLDDLDRALADGEPPTDDWLIELANRLAGLPGHPIVVLDDLHELGSAAVLDRLQAFISLAPPSLHFVLLTRTKPPWPLASWLGSGLLAEIDARDLRFTDEEVAEVARSAGIELGDEDVTTLYRWTEGWVGGIKLALASMRHAADPGDFVARIASNDELVSSYLLREVVEQQPAELRAFLLDISTLTEFTPELCDLLRKRDDSHDLLERCWAENLFIVKPSVPGGATRLHGLFSQFLQARLGIDDPKRRTSLHREASAIFEARGEIRSAIFHAVEIEDQGRLDELIARYVWALAGRGEFGEIQSWLPLLRRAEASDRPATTLSLAATLTLSDRPTEALAVLDDLEARPISPSVRYAAAQHRLLGVMRSGNVDALAANVAALADLPSDSTASCDDDVVIPFARDRFFHHFAGTAAYLDGDLPAARDAYERAAMNREATDFLYCQSVGALARVMYGTGELDDADRLAKESLRRQVELGIGETVVVLPAYHALGDVAWERNQLDDAEEYLARARRAVQPLWWEMVRVQASASRVLASRGELDEARAGLLECGQTYLDGTGSTRLHAVLCEHAVALALRASDIDEARKWVQARAMYTDRPLKISLQLRMSASETTRLDSIGLDEALVVKQPLPDRLDTLLAAATVVGCVGDDGRCDDLVAQALRLAAPGGFVVRFVDASRQVHAAVRNIASTGPAEQEPTAVDPFFVATVLAALDENLATGRRANTHSTELFEQLTERELEVLDLLVAEESYRTIGSKLFVSRNTVKSHVRHIYQKLGVGDRDAAVEKARQLELA